MALTKPYINTFGAFDVAQGTNEAYISVLGGDVITGYAFQIYSNSNNIQVYPVVAGTWQETTVSDVATSEIRNFNISFQGILSVLANNSTYHIIAKTFNGSTYSVVSQQTIFECYTTPNFSFEYVIGGDYAPLSDSTNITASSATVRLTFNKVDKNSSANLNSANIYLYGIDSANGESLVFSGSTLYNIPLVQKINGFSPTSGDNKIYDSYKLVASGITVEGLRFSNEITGLTVSYISISISPNVTVMNLRDMGMVQITSTLSSFAGTSNPVHPTYIDNSEVDLTDSGTYVEWINLFEANEPFTLRLSVRDLSANQVVAKIYGISSTDYVELKYETVMIDDGGGEIEYGFIGLYAYYNSNLLIGGQPQQFFPYYIESQKIATSSITAVTSLFVGVQASDDLYEIWFQTI